MKTQSLPKHLFTCATAALLACATGARADTVLTFDTVTPPQFHNSAIPQSFGDFASNSSSGISMSGIGTPDIDVSWAATNNPANANSPSQRWDYYSIGGGEDFWRLAQLNQSRVGDYHEIRFTPVSGTKAVIKSFKFQGYYPIILNPTNSLYYQEWFTYRWEVMDTNFASLTSANYSFGSNSNKDHVVNVNYTGTANQPLILRLTRLASTLGGAGGTTNDPIRLEGDPADIGIDDITFSEETSNPNPIASVSSAANGETNSLPQFYYRATILDGFSTQTSTNTIKLTLDGNPLSPTIGKTGLVTTVTFSAGGLIRSGSTHTYALVYKDNAGSPASYTNQTTFTVQNYTGYEWRFLNGDLGTSLGNGTMSYSVDGTGTTFGTTDGGTVPHINGTPAKYMHVPGFTDDSYGYWLTFADSPPNVGTASYLNRWTLIFDFLMPDLNAENSDVYIVPFFNTDPYNLSDADFYLTTAGELGIGGGGYTGPGVITANTWNRVAFVADLAANTLTYYVNGTSVKTRSADGLGGTWSLYSNQDGIPSLLLFNEGDSSGIYTHNLYLSSVAFSDRPLGASELSALGAPKASGILAPSFAPKPTLNIGSAGGAAVVSWPTNYVGYSLEQSDTVVSPQWKPTAGITNNSATLSPGATAKFYRLVQ